MDEAGKRTSAGKRYCSHAAPCVLGMDLAVGGGLLQRQQCVLAKLQSGEAGMSMRIASSQSENQPSSPHQRSSQESSRVSSRGTFEKLASERP